MLHVQVRTRRMRDAPRHFLCASAEAIGFCPHPFRLRTCCTYALEALCASRPTWIPRDSSSVGRPCTPRLRGPLPHTRTPAAVSSAASARLACREYQGHPPHAPLPARRLLAAARTPKVAMPVGLQPAVRRWERLPSRSSPLRRFASLFASARAARSMSLCRTPSPYTAISLRVRDLAISAGRAATPPLPYSTRIIHTP